VLPDFARSGTAVGEEKPLSLRSFVTSASYCGAIVSHRRRKRQSTLKDKVCPSITPHSPTKVENSPARSVKILLSLHHQPLLPVMKKYLLCLLLCPLFAAAQQPDASLLLGLSINSTTTGVAPNSVYTNRPNSSFVFPEVHILGDIPLAKNTGLWFRLEGGLTYVQVKYTLQGGNGTTSYRSDFKVNEVRFNLNPQLLYRFTDNKHAGFYVAAGPGVSAITADNNKTDMSSYQSGIYTASVTEDYSTSWLSFAGNIKAGCFIGDRYDVYLDFVKPFAVGQPTDFLDFNDESPSKTTKQYIFKIGVNYRFPNRDGRRQHR
jgi:hypothetical protein